MKHLRLSLFDIGSLSDVENYKPIPDRVFKVELVCPVVFDFVLTTFVESLRLKKIELNLAPRIVLPPMRRT
jgi:hypothetical protein